MCQTVSVGWGKDKTRQVHQNVLKAARKTHCYGSPKPAILTQFGEIMGHNPSYTYKLTNAHIILYICQFPPLRNCLGVIPSTTTIGFGTDSESTLEFLILLLIFLS